MLRSHSRLESGFFNKIVNNLLSIRRKTYLILKAEIVQLLLQIARILVLTLLQQHRQFIIANHVIIIRIVARLINRIGLIALGDLGAECLAINSDDSEWQKRFQKKNLQKFCPKPGPRVENALLALLLILLSTRDCGGLLFLEGQVKLVHGAFFCRSLQNRRF